MVDRDPNEAPDANTQRARREFDRALAVAREFIDSSPFTVWTETVSNDYRDGLIVIERREKDLPADFAFDVVNVISRLKAALNKATLNVVLKNGRGISGVMFPFGEWELIEYPPFEASLSAGPQKPIMNWIGKSIDHLDRFQKLRNKLTDAQWNALVSLRPWPGSEGDIYAWAINEIANLDKHKGDLVRANAAVNQRREFHSGTIDYAISYPEGFDHLLDDPTRERVILHLGPEAARSMDLRVSQNIVFGDNVQGLGGASVMPILAHQIAWTERAVNTLRPFF